MSDSRRSAGAAGPTATELSGEPAPNEKRTPPNTCTVIHDRGSEEMHFDRENVEKLLAGDSFFWLDIDQPDADDYKILRDVFKFHPLAVEDSEKFGQRAKIDDYDDYVFLVVYGAVPDDDRLVEVHCFYSEKFLVTVHRDECAGLHRGTAALREARASDRGPGQAPLSDHRRTRRQLLPAARRLRRSNRRARKPDLPPRRRRAAPGDLQDEAASGRLRKAITPERDLFARLDRRRCRPAGHERGGRALLPRHLRPPDPDQRPDRHLPRPAHRARWTSTSRPCPTGSTR